MTLSTEVNAIVFNHVSKSFRVYTNKATSLKERVLLRRQKHKLFWAVRDVSFSVKPGESVALVGKNGSGKSTVLKLLSRIIYPTEGHIELNGRIAGLLELGAGFQPDFTGRENIYINGAILGFTRREIDERIDDIIAFSEIEDFIDTPVRNYSSGMYMRLAFSIAISVNPDIFLIDEVLSVGDMSFQQKCMARLEQLKSEGVTIVLVSHSSSQVESVCDRAIWINEGVVQLDGDSATVVRAYETYMQSTQVGS